ncbi:MAG: hypothetical protein HQK72_14915 [Desulfamplus sp.]|nr:hypothetical protein [Desulfamplus sp.]
MFTIKYIADDTGLSIPYIRKCLEQLDEVLKPHYTKGACNKIQFSQNGYIIFDQIKQLKGQGLNLTAIKDRLEQSLQECKQGETVGQNLLKPTQISASDINLFNKLFQEKEERLKERAKHQELLIDLERRHLKEKEEYQQQISEFQQVSTHLKSQLLYLTDGRSPEEVKHQWQQEQMDKQRIAAILKEIEELDGIFSNLKYTKRKKLYKELQGLISKQST